ncbi:MAG: hypothetical protein IJ220_01430 [Clostridia bacterium]|nr:hypothetical protein [Clostridia bacterium]
MKKIILVISMIMVLFTSPLSYATANENEVDSARPVETTEKKQIETMFEETQENSLEQETTSQEKSEDITPAAQKIIENKSKKDEKIANYMEKYGDQTFAYTAYYLDFIQLYSIPVCIIGITIGAFNFYIIGEKKLDKREKGFSFIMAFLCGLVFFQVLPFIFALVVAGK